MSLYGRGRFMVRTTLEFSVFAFSETHCILLFRWSIVNPGLFFCTLHLTAIFAFPTSMSGIFEYINNSECISITGIFSWNCYAKGSFACRMEFAFLQGTLCGNWSSQWVRFCSSVTLLWLLCEKTTCFPFALVTGGFTWLGVYAWEQLEENGL